MKENKTNFDPEFGPMKVIRVPEEDVILVAPLSPDESPEDVELLKEGELGGLEGIVATYLNGVGPEEEDLDELDFDKYLDHLEEVKEFMRSCPYDLQAAHKFSNSHKPELEKDKVCGCFYCMRIYDPKEIKYWIIADNPCDRRGTAVCPYCGIDSVIGESSGFPITKEFLKYMRHYWFF